MKESGQKEGKTRTGSCFLLIDADRNSADEDDFKMKHQYQQQRQLLLLCPPKRTPSGLHHQQGRLSPASPGAPPPPEYALATPPIFHCASIPGERRAHSMSTTLEERRKTAGRGLCPPEVLPPIPVTPRGHETEQKNGQWSCIWLIGR